MCSWCSTETEYSGSSAAYCTKGCPGFSGRSEKSWLSNNNPINKEISTDDSSEFGYLLQSHYFDCEADLSDANTGSNAIYAFHPQNKYPQTFMSVLLMGLRQARTYIMFYPKTEKCGAYVKWSQSKVNPVDEIEINVQGKFDSEEQKYYYSGNKLLIKSSVDLIKPSGKTSHRLNLKIKTDPGNIKNEVGAQYVREQSSGMKEYTVCFNYKNDYPPFPQHFEGADLDEQLTYKALLKLRYGQKKSCLEADGIIVSKIVHSTTPESVADLKDKDHYKNCMQDKTKPEWVNRKSLPLSPSCWLTKYDASNARKYSWDVKFQGVTPEVRSLFEKAEGVLKTAVLPFWDFDPNALSRSIDNQPELKLDIKFKKKDKLVDVKLKTDKGVSEFSDQPVNIPVFGGPLTNLRQDSFGLFLVTNNIVDWCLLTSADMRMLDNTTIPFQVGSCWTLISSHCGPVPTYAVFVKKAGAMPLQLKVYMGGHVVEMTPTSKTAMSVKVNGAAFNVADGQSKPFKSGSSDIFKISNWAGTYFLMSDRSVVVNFDGYFAQVIPNMLTKGQHCGACGNYDGSKFTNFQGKQGQPVAKDQLSSEWCQ